MTSPKRKFGGTEIEIGVDDKGQFAIKTDPMFAKELGKALREAADLARVIVRTDHEKTRKVIVNREVVDKKSTGRLRSSIQPYNGRAADITRGLNSVSGEISAGSARAPYARYVHEGTLPHVIRAKPGGHLVFYGVNGGNYTITRKRLISEDDMQGDDGFARGARNARGRRNAKIAAGNRPRLRYSDKDVYSEDVTYKRADRKVVTKKVDHPGYRGHRFLNQAIAIVFSKKYGVVIPQNIVTRNARGPFPASQF